MPHELLVVLIVVGGVANIVVWAWLATDWEHICDNMFKAYLNSGGSILITATIIWLVTAYTRAENNWINHDPLQAHSIKQDGKVFQVCVFGDIIYDLNDYFSFQIDVGHVLIPRTRPRFKMGIMFRPSLRFELTKEETKEETKEGAKETDEDSDP